MQVLSQQNQDTMGVPGLRSRNDYNRQSGQLPSPTAIKPNPNQMKLGVMVGLGLKRCHAFIPLHLDTPCPYTHQTQVKRSITPPKQLSGEYIWQILPKTQVH